MGQAVQPASEGLSLSVWDNEESLLTYKRSELRRNMAQEVENLYRGEFWVKHFQVTDSDRRQPIATTKPRRVPGCKEGREQSRPFHCAA